MDLNDIMNLIPIKADTEQDRTIPIESIGKFSEVSNSMDRLLIFIGLHTGISMEEALSIRKVDMDFVGQTIKVYDRQKKRERMIYVPKWLCDQFKEYVTSMNGQIDYVFPMNKDAAYKHVTDWTERVLGYKRSWRALNRTYVMWCHQNGTPIDLVAENSGIDIKSLLPVWAKSPDEKRKLLNGENDGKHRKRQ